MNIDELSQLEVSTITVVQLSELDIPEELPQESAAQSLIILSLILSWSRDNLEGCFHEWSSLLTEYRFKASEVRDDVKAALGTQYVPLLTHPLGPKISNDREDAQRALNHAH